MHPVLFVNVWKSFAVFVESIGLAWLGLAWLGLAWLGLAWLAIKDATSRTRSDSSMTHISQGCEFAPDGAHRPASAIFSSVSFGIGSPGSKLRTLRRALTNWLNPWRAV